MVAKANKSRGSGDAPLLERLQRSEERLRMAVEGARLAIWEYDIVAGRLIPTPEIAEVLGLSP